MGLYQSLSPTGTLKAIGICDRCRRKFNLVDLRPDGDTKGLLVCKDCRDVQDPYKRPMRRQETISLRNARNEQSLLPTPQIFMLTGDLVEASFDVINDELVENLQTDNPLYIQTPPPDQPEEDSLWIQI